MIFASGAVRSLLARAIYANFIPRQDQLWKNLVVGSCIKCYKITNAQPAAANIRIPSSRWRTAINGSLGGESSDAMR